MDFKLIDGEFNAQDAIPLVTALYEAKITFHNRKLLTLHEHNEIDVEQIEHKISDLEANREQIIKTLRKAAIENKQVKIKSLVFLEVLDGIDSSS